MKTIDSTAGLEVARPDAIRVYRKYTGDGNKDAAFVFREIIGGLKGYRHPLLYCEIINEPSQWDTGVIDFAETIVPQLHAAGVRVALPCWSTGTPEESVWQAWRARGWAGADAVAAHLYFGKQGITPWHVGRPFRFWQPGDPPVMATECGEDAIEDGAAGWQAAGFSGAEYVSKLADLDAYFARFPYFLGGVVFTAAPTDPRWGPFSTDPLVDLILTGQPAPVPIPPPEGGAIVPDQTPAQIAAIEGLFNITHHDGAEFYLAELMPRPDPNNITIYGPPGAPLLVATKDEQHRATGSGQVDMEFGHPGAYSPMQGEQGFYYGTCGDARVDGLGWALLPGDKNPDGSTPPHRNVTARFARRTQPAPPAQPPPPVSGGGGWSGAFAGFAADHSEVGQPVGPIAYLPQDTEPWPIAAQLSASHILLWDGAAVHEIKRQA